MDFNFTLSKLCVSHNL